MITAIEKILVTCPHCNKKLSVPAESLGKKGRCPSCSDLFQIEAPPAVKLVEPTYTPKLVEPTYTPAKTDPYRGASTGGYALQPLSGEANVATTPLTSPYPPAAAPTSPSKYQHGFGWEHRGWDKGMLGGLAMMGIAAVWFLGGLACGIIFYYPPILFVIGLVGFVRGLFTGNVTGR